MKSQSKSIQKKLQPTHSEMQRQVKEYLQWKGWYVIRHQAGPLSHDGLSDLSAIKNGITIYIEIKTGNARLRKGQQAFRAEIEARGGTYIVARSIECLQERGI